jgi:hypothetical protein
MHCALQYDQPRKESISLKVFHIEISSPPVMGAAPGLSQDGRESEEQASEIKGLAKALAGASACPTPSVLLPIRQLGVHHKTVVSR